MIGLGSNRLTVCRRGGMSVTQAGRGGMEWLAGGRMPSWASPYSAQATVALQDAFTAAQWATIRDYGFAHPALVPFINEDPMMVMSLIDGLGTRWLVGDGNSWVITDYKPKGNTEVYFSIYIMSQSNYPFMYKGKSGHSGNGLYGLMTESNTRLQYQYAASFAAWNGSSIINKILTVSQVGGHFYIPEVSFNVTTSGTFDYSQSLPLQILDSGLQANITPFEVKENGERVAYFVPFCNPNDRTRQGMLDIHDLEHPVFHENKGTGTFGTEITNTSTS